MKYRTLDTNGDYSFGKSMQEFKANNNAVVQAVGTNLRLLKGEWWEDIGEGLPLFQNILKMGGSADHLKVADMLIKERILSTAGVAEIKSFTSDLTGRSYSATCSVQTIFGGVSSVEVTF